MIIEILTLFPEFYASILNRSIISRALKRGIVKVNLHDLRKFSSNKHNKVDDTPYGGGEGMVLQFPPIYDAIMKLKDDNTKVYIIASGKSTIMILQWKCQNLKDHINMWLL